MMISGIGSGEFPDYIDVLKVPFVSVSTSSGRCNATRVSAVLVEGLKNWGVQTVNKWADTLCESPEIYQGKIGPQFFDMWC